MRSTADEGALLMDMRRLLSDRKLSDGLNKCELSTSVATAVAMVRGAAGGETRGGGGLKRSPCSLLELSSLDPSAASCAF